MKKYIQPAIKVKEIETEEMMAASELGNNPTSGLGGDGTKEPGNGGGSDGSHPTGAKSSIWSSFDE